MKYVGYTTTPLNERLSGHHGNIVNGTEGKAMLEHFTKVHSVIDIIIKPTVHCNDIGNLLLTTIFPYGLNDRIERTVIRDTFHHVLSGKPRSMYSLFNVFSNNRAKRGSGVQRRNITVAGSQVDSFNTETFLEEVIHSNTFSIANFTCKKILSLKLADIKKLALFVGKLMLETNKIYPYNEHLLFMIRNICLQKMISSYNIKIKDKSRDILTIDYINKSIDNINISSILHSDAIINLFPVNDKYYCKPIITYKYSKKIRSKVANYHDLNNEDHVCQWHCHLHPGFIDINSQHVVTGNFDIITNLEIKELLSKGLHFVNSNLLIVSLQLMSF